MTPYLDTLQISFQIFQLESLRVTETSPQWPILDSKRCSKIKRARRAVELNHEMKNICIYMSRTSLSIHICRIQVVRCILLCTLRVSESNIDRLTTLESILTSGSLLLTDDLFSKSLFDRLKTSKIFSEKERTPGWVCFSSRWLTVKVERSEWHREWQSERRL